LACIELEFWGDSLGHIVFFLCGQWQAEAAGGADLSRAYPHAETGQEKDHKPHPTVSVQGILRVHKGSKKHSD
jgi:hypothetical protein